MATEKKKTAKIDSVKVRMYCLGTGDCFVYKFYSGATEKFTMMIDCGSCKGGPAEFKPYLEDLEKHVKKGIDLLVVTHEHNDHVNGFAKCEDIFKRLTIKKAWFAWTENPRDPGGRAKDLLEKRSKMKMAVSNAIDTIASKKNEISGAFAGDYNRLMVEENYHSFLDGLNTLKEINLNEAAEGGKPLAGMVKLKALLKDKKVPVDYLDPGETLQLDELPGLSFHVLGPPYEKDAVFKEGKQGRDVYNKKLFLSGNSLSANAFINLGDQEYDEEDLPFSTEYIMDRKDQSLISSLATSQDYRTEGTPVINSYYEPSQAWRTVELDWLGSAGSLALRLNSHINNTSLVLAIESESSGKVMLLPGDAEFGSWESWHLIKKWEKKGKDGKKHLVEDLLNRTVFYKVGHHLSYNGTALEKGISMMEDTNLVAMATLDRKRISEKWKSTMPNKHLLQELIKRCKGKVFIMDETGVGSKPSDTLNPDTLPATTYKVGKFEGTKRPIYIEYRVRL